MGALVQLIPPIAFAYNAAVNRMTSYAPFELIYGRTPMFPVDLALNLEVNDIKCEGDRHEYVRGLAAHQKAIFAKANRTQDKYDERRKKYFDQGRKDVPLEVGDFVTWYAGDGRVGTKKKFQPRWNGIWTVKRLFGENALEIEELRTKKIKHVNRSNVKMIYLHMYQLI